MPTITPRRRQRQYKPALFYVLYCKQSNLRTNRILKRLEPCLFAFIISKLCNIKFSKVTCANENGIAKVTITIVNDSPLCMNVLDRLEYIRGEIRSRSSWIIDWEY